jgi:hypothetical protein
LELGVEGWGLGVGVSGFQVSGFKFQVSGFRFQVSSFKFFSFAELPSVGSLRSRACLTAVRLAFGSVQVSACLPAGRVSGVSAHRRIQSLKIKVVLRKYCNFGHCRRFFVFKTVKK